MVGIGGGAGVAIGTAHGRFRLDLSEVTQGRVTVVREAQLMSQAFNQMGRQSATQIGTLAGQLGALGGELTKLQGLGVVFGGLTAGGVAAAQSVRNLTSLFKVLVGSEEKSAAQMKNLRAFADDMHQPFMNVMEAATGLAQSVGRTNVELRDAVSVAQRLAILDPAQGAKGAAIAMREFLSGQVQSLVMRFEMDRGRLRQILAEAGGDQAKAVEGLNQYVNEIGLTEDALRKMGEEGVGVFQVLGSEVTETAAEAFTPFLVNTVIPTVQHLSAFFRDLRENHPVILQLAAGFVTVAAGATLLGTAAGRISTTLATVLSLLQKIAATEAIGSLASRFQRWNAGAMTDVAALEGGTPAGAGRLRGLTRAAVGVGALAVGTHFGGELIAGLANLGAPELARFKGKTGQDVLNEVGDTIKKIVVVLVNLFGQVITALTQFIGQVEIVGLRLQQAIGNVISGLVEAMGNLINGVADALAGVFDTTQMKQTAKNLWGFAEGVRITDEAIERYGEQVDQRVRDTEAYWNQATANLAKWLLPQPEAAKPEAEPEAAAKISRYTDEQLQAFAQYQEDLTDIQESAQQEREDELKAHEKRKTEIEAQYQKTLARMAEDEALRRRRAEADLDRRIAEVGAESQAHEIEEAEQHTARMAEIEASAAERQADEKEKHLAKLADLEEQHDEDVRNAAMNLDAVALDAANRRYEKAVKKENDDYDARMQDLQEELEERRQVEAEAHAQRLAEAQAAAAERIQQMRAEFDQQEALHAEDQAIQLARMEEDHQAELDALDVAHTERMGQIDAQEQEELDAREQAWIEEFNSLETHNLRMIATQEKGLNQLEAELDTWWRSQTTKGQQALAALEILATNAQQRLSGITNLVGGVISAIQGVIGGNTSQASSGQGTIFGIQVGGSSGVQSGAPSTLRSRYAGVSAEKRREDMARRIGVPYTNTTQANRWAVQQSRWGVGFGRQTGGAIHFTGAYMLHEGERVYRADTARLIDAMLRTGSLANAPAGRGMGKATGGATHVIERLEIVLGDIGRYTADEIKRLVQQGIGEYLDYAGAAT